MKKIRKFTLVLMFAAFSIVFASCSLQSPVSPDAGTALSQQTGQPVSSQADGQGLLSASPYASIQYLYDHLVGFWSFDKNFGNIALDDSGYGADGTLINGATSGIVPGVIGKAGGFSAVNAYVEIPDHPQFHLTNKITLSAWVKPDNVMPLQTIINKWYTPDSYMLSINAGMYVFTLNFPVGGPYGTPVSVSAPAVSNVWTHVAGVYDGMTIKIYLNGHLSGSLPLPASISSNSIMDSAMMVHIGSYPSWNSFQGLIDQAKIYNVGLNQYQIQLDMVLPAIRINHLVGYWNFNKNLGTLVVDNSGNGAHGQTLNGAASGIEPGVYGKSAGFHFADAEIMVPDYPQFHFSNEITISAWVKPDSAAPVQTILNKWYTPDSYMLSVGSGSYSLTIAFPDGGPFGTSLSVSAPATAGVWTYVAGTYKNRVLKLYINGMLTNMVTVPSILSNATIQQSFMPLNIGSHPTWNSFSGNIDEVKLYDIALDNGEVYWDMLFHY